MSVNPSVNISSVLPTLTSFTAEQGNSQVIPLGACAGAPLWLYKLGCLTSSPAPDRGIHFTANVHANSFISDPAQSGIKYVQAVSTFRKWMERGLRCLTIRSQESNVDSGWQLDGSDPYLPNDFPVRRFSEGNDLTMFARDYPGDYLTGFQAWQFKDSLYVDEQFWMYVVYFVGDNPASPFRQKTIGRLRWNWGGLVVFDPASPDFKHTLRFANIGATSRTGEPASAMVSMQGVLPLGDKPEVQCPGGPPLSANHVDSSRVLVREYYQKILGRLPDDGGWNAWTSYIAQCVFDQGCIVSRRSYSALGFFWSAEFIDLMTELDYEMTHPPGDPLFNAATYNRQFVYWCYQTLLDRDPDPGGWDAWTNYLNSTGDYEGVAHGFIYSNEYRNERPHL